MDENRKTSEIGEKNTNSLDFDAKIRELESVIAKYSEKAKSCEAVSPVVESIVSASFKKKMVAMVTVIALSIAMLVGSTNSNSALPVSILLKPEEVVAVKYA